MLNDYFNKIYYINLDKHIGRLDHCRLQISKSNLLTKSERFVGVDGYTVDLSKIDKTIITNTARSDILLGKQKIFGISLTYGSLGCALSHKKIFEECSVSEKPFLVLEDDFIIDYSFDDDLIDIINSIDEFDILYLGFHDIPSAKKQTLNDFISRPVGLTCGTYGYIISPQGALRLLECAFPLDCQIDSMISKNLSKMRSYCSKKTLVRMSNSFHSNTQHQISCNNIYSNIHSWMKLFK